MGSEQAVNYILKKTRSRRFLDQVNQVNVVVFPIYLSSLFSEEGNRLMRIHSSRFENELVFSFVIDWGERKETTTTTKMMESCQNKDFFTLSLSLSLSPLEAVLRIILILIYKVNSRR